MLERGQRTECKSDCVKNCAVPLFTATAIGSHSVYGHSSVSGMCSGKFDHLLRRTTISVLIFYKTETESHTERQRATQRDREPHRETESHTSAPSCLSVGGEGPGGVARGRGAPESRCDRSAPEWAGVSRAVSAWRLAPPARRSPRTSTPACPVAASHRTPRQIPTYSPPYNFDTVYLSLTLCFAED